MFGTTAPVNISGTNFFLKIGSPLRKRRLMWMARFGAEVAKYNARMIGRSQNTAEILSELIKS
jgi:hypothetical protein